MAFQSQMSPAALILAAIGSLTVLSYLVSLARLFISITFSGTSIRKFKSRSDPTSTWAVVTGATSGIGLEFSKKLAKKGFNVFLVSRDPVKLGEVAGEIESKSGSIKTKTHAIDLAKATEQEYEALGKELEGLDIGVLVNNAGLSHSGPTYFPDIDPADSRDIVQVNVMAVLTITRMVLPGMTQRRRGLILNIGSFSSLVPSPLLSVYSGSKAFLSTWSQALAEEVKSKGVQVSLINAYFVVSKLSKIRKSSWMTPNPSTYVDSVLSHIGQNGGASFDPYVSSPYAAHALAQWAVQHIGTTGFWMSYNRKMQEAILKRVLRKKQQANGGKKEL